MQMLMLYDDLDDNTVATDSGGYDDHVDQHHGYLQQQQRCLSTVKLIHTEIKAMVDPMLRQRFGHLAPTLEHADS